MPETIRKVRRNWSDFAFLLRQSRRTDFDDLGWSNKANLIFGFPKGFQSLLSIDNVWELLDYASEVERRRAARIMDKDIVDGLNDKLRTPDLFLERFRLLPRNLFLATKDGLFDPTDRTRKVRTKDEILSWPHKIVLKPVSGVTGKCVHVLEVDGSTLRRDGKRFDLKKFACQLEPGSSFLGCEFIEQHPIVAALYPRATNTIRVITYRDPDTSECKIADAIIRIGTKLTEPVDNGGLVSSINMETGAITAAAAFKKMTYRQDDGKLKLFSTHPDTGSQIEGVVIPHFRKILREILTICRYHPKLEFIGWDIVVVDSERGFSIIEANEQPDFSLHQLHGSLIANLDFRYYLDRKDVLMKRRKLLEIVRRLLTSYSKRDG